MKAFNKKKGFTIVELVIVVAVIGVLTAVLVPTFVNLVNKANEASNQSFVKNLNTQMAMREGEEGKNKTMHEAILDARDIGFDVEKLTPVNGRDLVWDSIADRFLLLESDGKVWYGGDEKKATKDIELWKVYDSMPALAEQKYSIYAKKGWNTAVVTGITVGFDSGSNANIKTLNVVNSDENKAINVRTEGGTLNIGTSTEVAKGTITHYGTLDSAVVYTTGNSFHTHGAIGRMELKAGKAVAEENGIVYLVEAKGEGVEVLERDGGKFVIPTGVSTEDIPTDVASTIGYTPKEGHDDYNDAVVSTSKAYEIGSLSSLKTFRDLVNGGFSFQGCTVKLTSDITLDDGWSPIGEGSRKVGATGYAGNYAGENAAARIFRGEFDGNGKTISNLNNKGFTPKFTSEDDGIQKYCYGFFGIVTGEAKLHDVKFANVHIDTKDIIKNANEENSVGDSVGSLVGFIDGNATISNITVAKGSTIKAIDAVGGIIGRWYGTSGSITLNSLENGANCEVSGNASKVAGLVGYINGSTNITFTDCQDTGNCTNVAESEGYADLFMCYGNASSNKNRFTFTGNCSATGTLQIDHKGSVEYGVWTVTHTNN